MKINKLCLYVFLSLVSCFLFLGFGCGGSTTSPTTSTTTTSTATITTTTETSTISTASTSTTLVSTTTTTTTTTTTNTTTTTIPLPPAAAPNFVLASGSFESSSVLVTIECTTEGTDIYYTLDNSTPTSASPHYTGPITLTSSKVVKTIARKSGMSDSPVASHWYDIYWWQAVGGGINNIVNDIDLDGQGNLYVGGIFTNVNGNSSINYLAKWNGTAWSGYGSDQWINAVKYISDDVFYVGGEFSLLAGVASTDGIAKWSETTWESVGGGVVDVDSAPFVYLITTGEGASIYVSGPFSSAVGASAHRIAKWNNSSWEALDGGIKDNQAYAIVPSNSSGIIFVGGTFTEAGGNPALAYLAKWNGSTWEALGTGINEAVYCIKYIAEDLYISGLFTNAGGNPNADYVAKWNGSNWTAVGSGLWGASASLVADNSGRIYSTVDGVSPNKIARFNGSTWEAFGGSFNGQVFQLLADNISGSIYARGSFTDAGGVAEADYLAKWGKVE